jgi:hypothetical protein
MYFYTCFALSSFIIFVYLLIMGALKNMAAGAAAGSSAGIWGSAIGAGAGLLGSFLGIGSQKATNKANLKMMREQNAFNAQQSELHRAWLQEMQNKYGTASAQAAQYRAAGLNPLLSSVSPQSIGSGAPASASEAIPQQPLNFSGVGASVQNGLQYYQQQQSITNQKVVQDSVAALNETQGALNKALELQSNQSVEESKQTVSNLKLAYDFSAQTLATRVRQQYLQEDMLNWQQSDMKYSAITKMYDLFNIKPEVVHNMQSSTFFNYASAFRAAAEGRMTLREIQYLPKKYAIMNTMALGSYLSGRGSLLSGYASARNAYTLDRNTKPQYELDRFTTDYLLGKKDDDDALSYIKGDVRLKHLLDINIANNEWTLNKLMEEPTLIRNLGNKYGQESSILEKDNQSYWTDKAIDRGVKFVDATANAVETYTGLKHSNRSVKEKHNYKYDWKSGRWDHEISVEKSRGSKK